MLANQGFRVSLGGTIQPVTGERIKMARLYGRCQTLNETVREDATDGEHGLGRHEGTLFC